MVENKHSINTILSFGAKSVNPEVLESLLTGRDKTADFLEKKVKSIAENGDNQFILVIGQRGMGKTHLLRVLHSRILPYTLENKLIIAYFAEEEYGVANFFDFLLRILNSFIKWNDKDADNLRKELENLQNTSVNNQLNYLEKIIRDYVKAKPLVIITENFGDILDQMGQEEQGRLRAWLYENNNVSIVASSQSISDNFDREDRPFYGFFTPYYLKTLSFEESYSFLISLAEIEKNDKLVEHLKTNGKPQIRAIYDLVKGNHRLLVTFFNFLKTDMLAKVSENFIKTINDLKPYYETYIRYLPAQQQKILRYIALSRKPQLGIEISKNCFIEQKSLSKQLSELNKKRLIDIIADPSDKRNKFYDISEPLLRISIEVGEHKEGITALFIDFLALYYDADELINKRSKFLNLIDYCEKDLDKRNYEYEIDAINKALSIKNEFLQTEFRTNILKIIFEDKNYQNAIDYTDLHLSGQKNYKFKNLVYSIIAEQSFDSNNPEKSYNYFKKVNETDIENFMSSEGEFIFKKCHSYIAFGLENNNLEIVDNGLEMLNRIKNLNSRYYLFSILTKITVLEKKSRDTSEGILEETEKIFNELKSNTKLFKIANKEKSAFYGVLLTLYVFTDDFFENIHLTSEIKEYFDLMISKEKKNTKITIVKAIISVGDFRFFEDFKDFIEINIKQFNHEIVNSINNILILEQLNLNQLIFLSDFTNNNKLKIPELTISEIYVNTYREVIIHKNESALYELPKEQREFFEQKILKRKP